MLPGRDTTHAATSGRWTTLPNLAILGPHGERRPNVEHYLTVPEVAELLKLSPKTVYRLAQKGELPGFKAGGSWRFRRRDLDAWASKLVRRQQGERS